MSGRSFTCSMCGGTFDNEWTDEEATAELAEQFPGTSKAECASACDDCFQQIMAWGRANGFVGNSPGGSA